MPKKDMARKWQPKYKQVAKQAPSQTAKANATPRIGQGMAMGGKSPYHNLFAQRSKHALDTPSYNVGRTRRMA